TRIGAKREDLPWIETQVDEEFRQSIIDFPKTQLPQIYDLLKKYQPSRKVIIFQSRAEADDYLSTFHR
ncbi:MAG: adenylate kinase, partial [Lachnospiraceae bacterium]|nr:adenylate kinase [Lachnospiraceae bacterium]